MLKSGTYNIRYTANFLPKAAEADVNFETAMLKHSAYEYDHALCGLCSQLMMISYDREKSGDCGIKEILNTIGFDKVEILCNTGADEEDTVLASGKMRIGNKTNTVVFASFVGSHGKQWYTNFDSGAGSTHKGFQAAADYAYGKLNDFLAELKVEKENTKIVLTGHSRGGAAANILAARLLDEGLAVLPENLFTYTFAAPSVTMKSCRTDKKYNCIFNIINEEDFVVKVMPVEWGFGRYGKTFAIPCADNTVGYGMDLGRMLPIYKKYSPGKTYAPFMQSTKQVNKLFRSLSGTVFTIDEYYGRKLCCGKEKISLAEFFRRSLCAITGELPGSDENKAGTQVLLDAFIKRPMYDKLFVDIADFFILYEGLAGATNGKILNTYFSYAHDISAYCAFVLTTEEGKMIKK